jgi:nitrogenase subunit NifH
LDEFAAKFVMYDIYNKNNINRSKNCYKNHWKFTPEKIIKHIFRKNIMSKATETKAYIIRTYKFRIYPSKKKKCS